MGDYHLLISGGQIVINAGGDGLDSNGTATMTGGTVVVNGPTTSNNGAIDVNGTFDVSGGTLLAAGSAGMAETPEQNSAQAWLSYTSTTTLEPGTVIAIVSDGSVLATFEVSKATQSVVYSASDLVAGQSYQIYTGATASGDSIGGMTDQGSVSSGQQVGTTTAVGA